MMPIIAPALLALQAPSTGTSPTGFIVMWGAILAIFYFLMMRPQQKQKRQHEERQKNLRKGDTIVTSGGIVGEVVHIKETVTTDGPQKTMDDLITIRSGDSRLVVVRRGIDRITSAAGTASPGT